VDSSSRRDNPVEQRNYAQSDFYTDILDNLYEGVFFVDPARHILYWNKGAERISGFRSAEVLGRSCSDAILRHMDGQGAILCQTDCPLVVAMADGQVRESEVCLRHACGHRVPVRLRAAPMRGPNGTIIGAIEIFSEAPAQAGIHKLSANPLMEVLTDPLTALSSRRYLEAQTRAALVETASDQGVCALLLVDIDDLETINRAYGRIVGDKLLAMVGDTLRRGIRTSDIAGRWSGDQFGVVLRGVTYEQLLAVANKLRLLVEHACLREGQHVVRVTVAIGAALARRGDSLETLTARATIMLRQSRAAGGNHLTISD
jgi:diguanylate cyclase (GGDEF)-like protein/PAS domain S-box-containing protein